MAGKIELNIVTPEQKVATVEVDEMRGPGWYGSFGVLPGHTPFLTVMQPGELMYRVGATPTYYAVGDGFIEVGGDRVSVLAETAEPSGEIDAERARRALADGQAKLKGLSPDDPTYALESSRVRRANARISVATRSRA